GVVDLFDCAGRGARLTALPARNPQVTPEAQLSRPHECLTKFRPVLTRRGRNSAKANPPCVGGGYPPMTRFHPLLVQAGRCDSAHRGAPTRAWLTMSRREAPAGQSSRPY